MGGNELAKCPSIAIQSIAEFLNLDATDKLTGLCKISKIYILRTGIFLILNEIGMAAYSPFSAPCMLLKFNF